MAEKKEKRYVSDNAQLIAEWNWEKNNELGFDPSKLTCGSSKKVWWKCNEGHEWEAKILNRNIGNGCPYCSGRKVLKGYNDLQTINSSLSNEWNYEKNKELTPFDVVANSNMKVWWRCSKGHEWQAKIANRNKGVGCPYCSGRYAVTGINDLQTVNPSLLKEWNYEKNGDLKPENFTPHSHKKIWWKCSNNHEWQASIDTRIGSKGCPYCSGRYAIAGQTDLQTVNPILAKEWNYEKNNGLTPSDVLPNSERKVWWKCNRGHEWQARIGHRNNNIGCPVCSSEQNTSFPEYAIVYYIKKYGVEVIHSYKEQGYELDIYIPSKKVAIEYDGYYWHKDKTQKDIEKNEKCKRDGIFLYRIREGLLPLNDSSTDYVIQRNQNGLSEAIEAIVTKIVGINVQVDIKRDIIEIENIRTYSEKEASILFSYPHIAKEWNYEKNGSLKPNFFTANSTKKVWWKCNEGHEWQARIQARTKGTGCPYCAGKKVVDGYNDLQTVNPTLAKEWNYEKNNGLTPKNFLPNSNKKVWWKCSEEHEWQATINNRNKGRSCPFCAGKKALVGFNDLKTTNQSLVEEWNYKKNGELFPSNVTAGSGKKVWWKCRNCGHEWQAIIANRSKGRGCPECAKMNKRKKKRS